MEEEKQDQIVDITEEEVDETLELEAFDEALGGEPKPKEKIEAKKEEVKEEKPEEKPKEEEKATEEKPEDKEDIKVIVDKAVKETKAWATQIAQENAELKKRLEVLEKGPSKEDEIPEEIKEVYENYPDFKKALDFEASRILKALKPSEDVNKVIAQTAFDAAVASGVYDEKDGWLEGHPDAGKIVHSQEFADWASKEKIPVDNVTDPKEAIRIIGKFKEFKVKGALQEHEKEQEKKREEKREVAGASISSVRGSGYSTTEKDQDDLSGAFKEAIGKQ